VRRRVPVFKDHYLPTSEKRPGAGRELRYRRISTSPPAMAFALGTNTAFGRPDRARGGKLDTVVIYRHTLFKPSEPFIVDQAAQLRGYHPLFVGRDAQGAVPPGALTVSPAGCAGALWRRWHSLTGRPNRFLHALRPYRPKLIHAHFAIDGLFALPVAAGLDVPLVTTLHGFDVTLTPGGLARSLRPALWRYAVRHNDLCRRGDLFICVSEFIRGCALQSGFPANRLAQHYIGIDVDAIEPGIKRDDRLVLTVGRLVEKKGTSDVIRAIGMLPERYKDVRLIVVGEGPLKRRLIALAQASGVAERVEFLGACVHERVHELMAKASVFCLPSVRARNGDAEGLGMVFLEAAAAEVPVVATNHGGIPEAVLDGATGFLVPERTPGALAERIAYLLDHPEVARSMGRAGRRLVKKKFDVRRQTERLELLYDTVL